MMKHLLCLVTSIVLTVWAVDSLLPSFGHTVETRIVLDAEEPPAEPEIVHEPSVEQPEPVEEPAGREGEQPAADSSAAAESPLAPSSAERLSADAPVSVSMPFTVHPLDGTSAANPAPDAGEQPLPTPPLGRLEGDGEGGALVSLTEAGAPPEAAEQGAGREPGLLWTVALPPRWYTHRGFYDCPELRPVLVRRSRRGTELVELDNREIIGPMDASQFFARHQRFSYGHAITLRFRWSGLPAAENLLEFGGDWELYLLIDNATYARWNAQLRDHIASRGIAVESVAHLKTVLTLQAAHGAYLPVLSSQEIHFKREREDDAS